MRSFFEGIAGAVKGQALFILIFGFSSENGGTNPHIGGDCTLRGADIDRLFPAPISLVPNCFADYLVGIDSAALNIEGSVVNVWSMVIGSI